MNQSVLYSSERGQGLLELVAALGLVVTGMTVALTLAVSNVIANREAENRVIAANLSREGIEVLEHVRFSNIDLNNLNWAAGLDPGSYIARWQSASSPPWALTAVSAITDPQAEFRFQESGELLGLRLQGVSTGTPTGFRRLITLRDICQDHSIQPTGTPCPIANQKIGILLNSQVQWGNSSRKTVIVEETLYHWQ